MTPAPLLPLKRLLVPRLDIPFARDDAHRFLPWFIALMVFLAALFLAGGITVGELLRHKRQDLSQWLTVQIPAGSVAKAHAGQVEAMLAGLPQIEKVEQREEAEVQALVAPWFGQGELLKELPLPILIEARIKTGETLNTKELRRKLQRISAKIALDDHQSWLEHYLSFVRLLEWGAYLLAALIGCATLLMIVFTSKTALKLHEDAVWLLHSVGALDDYIARQFQFNAFLLGMRGALIGVAPAATLFFALGVFTQQFQAPLLPSLPIGGWHIALWIGLPLATGFLAMAVARKTVLAMLRRMA